MQGGIFFETKTEADDETTSSFIFKYEDNDQIVSFDVKGVDFTGGTVSIIHDEENDKVDINIKSPENTGDEADVSLVNFDCPDGLLPVDAVHNLNDLFDSPPPDENGGV